MATENQNNIFEELAAEANPFGPTRAESIGAPPVMGATVAELNRGQPLTLPRDPSGSVFKNSFDAGIQHLWANSAYFSALINDLQGDTEAATQAIQRAEGRERMAAKAMGDIPSVQDFFAEPTVGGFLTQAVSALGQFAPSAIASIVSAFATGGTTAVIGSTARIAAGKGIKSELKRIAAKIVTGAPVSSKERIFVQRVYDTMRAHPGLVAGAFGQEFVQGSGISYGDFAGQDMRGAESALKSLGMGVAYGAIGTFGEAAITQSYLDLAKSRFLKGRGGMLRNVLVHGGIKSSIGEGTAETLQESLSVAQKFAIDPDYDAAQAKMDMGTAAFMGFMGGFGMGLGTGTAGSIVGRVANIGREQMQNAYERVIDKDYTEQAEGFSFAPSMFKTASEPEAWLISQIDALFDETLNEQGVRNIEKPAAFVPYTETMDQGQTNEFLERNGFQDKIDKGELLRADLENGVALTRDPKILEKIQSNKWRNVPEGQEAEDILLKEILGYSAVGKPTDQFVMEVVTNDGKEHTVHYQSYADEAAWDATFEAVKKVVPGIGPNAKYKLLHIQNKSQTVEEHLKDRHRLTMGEAELQIDSFAADLYEGTEEDFKGDPLMQDGRFVEMSPFISEVALNKTKVKAFKKGQRAATTLSFSPRITAPNYKKQAFVRKIRDRFDTQGTFTEADYANLSAMLVEKLATIAESTVDSRNRPFENEAERQKEIGKVTVKVSKTLSAIKKEDIGKPKSEVYGRLYDLYDVNNPKNPDNPRNRTGVNWADTLVTPGHLEAMNVGLDRQNAQRGTDKKILAYGRKDPQKRTNFDVNDPALVGKPMSHFFTEPLVNKVEELIVTNSSSNFEIELDLDPDSPTYGLFTIDEIGAPTDIGIYTVQQLINVGITEAIEAERKRIFDGKKPSGWYIKGRKDAEHISKKRKDKPIGLSMTQLALRGAKANDYGGLTTQPEATDYKAFEKWLLDGFLTALLELDNLGYDMYLEGWTGQRREMVRLGAPSEAVTYNTEGKVDLKNRLDVIAPYLNIYVPKEGVGGRNTISLKRAVDTMGKGPLAKNIRDRARINKRIARYLTHDPSTSLTMYVDYRLVLPKAEALEKRRLFGEEITPDELEKAANETPIILWNRDVIKQETEPKAREKAQKELRKPVLYTRPYYETDENLLNDLEKKIPGLRFREAFGRGKEMIREMVAGEGVTERPYLAERGEEEVETFGRDLGKIDLPPGTPFGKEIAEMQLRLEPENIVYSDKAVAAATAKAEKLAIDYIGQASPKRVQDIISGGLNYPLAKKMLYDQQKAERLKRGIRQVPMEAYELSKQLKTRNIPFGQSFSPSVQERLSEQIGEKSLAERLYDIAHINFKLDPAMKLVVIAADDDIDTIGAFRDIPVGLKKFLKENQTIVREVEAEKGRRIRVGDTNVIILRIPGKIKRLAGEYLVKFVKLSEKDEKKLVKYFDRNQDTQDYETTSLFSNDPKEMAQDIVEEYNIPPEAREFSDGFFVTNAWGIDSFISYTEVDNILGRKPEALAGKGSAQKRPAYRALTDEEFTEVVLVYGHELGHIILDQESYMGNSLSWAVPPMRQETYKQRLLRAYEQDLKNRPEEAVTRQWMEENGLEEWFADKSSTFLLDEFLGAKNGGEAVAKQAAVKIKKGWKGIENLLKERFTRNSIGYEVYQRYAKNVVQSYKEGTRTPRRHSLTALQKALVDSMFQDSFQNINTENAAHMYKTILTWGKDVKNGGVVPRLVRKLLWDTANYAKGIGTTKQITDRVLEKTGIDVAKFGGAGSWAVSRLTGISQSRTPQGLQQSVNLIAKAAINKVEDMVLELNTADYLTGEGKYEVGENNRHLLLVEDETIPLWKEEKVDTRSFTAEDIAKYEKALENEVLWVWVDGGAGNGRQAVSKTDNAFGIALEKMDVSMERLFNKSRSYPKIVFLQEKGLKYHERNAVKKGIAAMPKVTTSLPILNEQGYPIPNVGDGTVGTLTPQAFEAKKYSRQFSKDEQLAEYGVNIRPHWGFGRQLDWVEIGQNPEIQKKVIDLAVETHKGKEWPIRVYSERTWTKLKKGETSDGLNDVRFFKKPIYEEEYGESRKVGDHYYRVVKIDEAFATQTLNLILSRPDFASIDSPQEALSDSDLAEAIKNKYPWIDPESKDLSIGILPERSRLFGQIPTKKLRKTGALADPWVAMERYFRNTIKSIAWKKKGGWQPVLAVINAVREIDQQAGDDLKEAITYSLGNYNGDISAPLRSLNSWGLFLNISTLLAFAVFASFPDFAGPIVRSKEFKAIGNVKDVLSEYWNDADSLRQFARDVGVIAQESLETIFATAADLDWMQARPRLWSAYFFQYTFTEGYTRFMRTFASGMGRQFVLDHMKKAKAGDEKSVRFLAELADPEGNPLTWQEVEAWTKTNYNKKTGKYTFNGPEGRRMRLAIGRFVDESIIRPTALDRPLYSNDPRYSLVFQLKTFFYTYGKVVVGGVARESFTRLEETGKISAALAPLLLYATTVIPLTMLGWDLRERVKYLLAVAAPGVDANWKTIGRSHTMNPGAYWMEVLDRTGSFGPWTQGFQMQQSAQWGKFFAVPLFGPTAERFEDLFLGRYTLQDNVPIFSQLPRAKWKKRTGEWEFSEEY